MPTSVRAGTSISTGFKGTSISGGSGRIGSFAGSPISSTSTLASKINSFQRVSLKESSRGPASLSAKDMSFGSATLKSFNNPNRSESKPSVKFLGNINQKTFTAYGENKSSRPNPTVRTEPRLSGAFAHPEASRARPENPVISFKPDRVARGAERFGINNSNRAKGLERFQNLPYINIVDRVSSQVGPVKEAKSNQTRVEKARDIPERPFETKFVPAPQTDKKDRVNSDRISASQTRSLLSLEPLVALGIITSSEAKKRVGITEEDPKQNKVDTKAKPQDFSRNNPEKTAGSIALPTTEPDKVAAKAQELSQLLQVMQIAAKEQKALSNSQISQSTGTAVIAERAQKLAAQLQSRTDVTNAASSEMVETIGQKIQSRLKKVVRVVTKAKKYREETADHNDRKIRVRFFQEDHAAKKARIDDATRIYELIKAERERAGNEDTIKGKDVAKRYKLTDDKRGRVLRQQGTEQEDGTSIDIWRVLEQIDEITPEKIVAANEIKGLMAVEMVDQVKTEASKKEAVRRTFEQNKDIGQIALTEADEQVVSYETVEMTTSQPGESTSTTKKIDEPAEVIEEVVEPEQLVPEIDRQLASIQKTLKLDRFIIPQRLSLVS
jgi:hypothetical protein